MNNLMFVNSIKFNWNKNSRTGVVLKNVSLSFFLKGFSIIVSFLLVPLSLNAVGKKEYGVFLTIISIVNWINYFDIGIGNGLRNKLGKALAEKKFELAVKYVSTAYYYIILICIGIFILFLSANFFINWYAILNIKQSEFPSLNWVIIIVVLFFVLRFIFQLIGVILLADQRSSINDAILPLSNLLMLIIIVFLKYNGLLNFNTLIVSSCITPLFLFIFFTARLFNGMYKYLRPQFKHIDHSLRKDLLELGFKFFLLQIIGLIIFSTSNILIAQLYNISYVTEFNIASKYYGIVTMILSIILTPLWSAYTHAWYQDDKAWITKNIQRFMWLNIFFLGINMILFFLFPFIGKIWLGNSLEVSTFLSFGLIFYNFQFIYNNIFSFFLNGVGKINLQLYSALIGGVINIPLTFFLAHNFNWGIANIVFANIICLLPSSILTTIQTFKLLKGNQTRFWNN